MKRTTKVSQEEWQKLADFAKATAKDIRQKLPADWGITLDDITSALLGEMARLITTYRHGAMSLTSYCYEYAPLHVTRDLLREYKTLKNQLEIYDLIDPDEKDGNTHHAYGKADVQAMTVDYRDVADTQIDARAILDKATPDDKAIMLAIMAGKSYAEIAAERGIDKMAITRRMKKYMEVA